MANSVVTPATVDAARKSALAVFEREGSGPDDEGDSYCDQAALAVVHALQAALNDSAEDAAVTAMIVYETIYDFAFHLAEPDRMETNPRQLYAEVESHRLVQAELRRQHETLTQLARPDERPEALESLRGVARAEAPSFFGDG